MTPNGASDTAADDSGLSPSESLALIEGEHVTARKSLAINPVLTCGAWGAAWLLGFGSAYLSTPGGGRVLAPWLSILLTIVLSAAAFVISAVDGMRAERGVHGRSRTTGRLYGLTWSLSFGALALVNVGVARLHLPSDALTLLWTADSALLVGVLYLAGGLLWAYPVQFVIGGWTVVVAGVSVFAGVPGNFLVLAFAGGGGFLVQAGYHAVRGRPGLATVRT